MCRLLNLHLIGGWKDKCIRFTARTPECRQPSTLFVQEAIKRSRWSQCPSQPSPLPPTALIAKELGKRSKSHSTKNAHTISKPSSLPGPQSPFHVLPIRKLQALSTPGQRRHVKILASHHPAVFTSVRESMCRCGSPHRFRFKKTCATAHVKSC